MLTALEELAVKVIGMEVRSLCRITKTTEDREKVIA
jgi:hypothetical protein